MAGTKEAKARRLIEAEQRLRYGTPAGVSGHVSVRADMAELCELSHGQRAAWLNGMAQVVAALTPPPLTGGDEEE